MSNATGILIALAIMAHAAASAWPILHGESRTGRFHVAPATNSLVWRIDTMTGEAWYSLAFKDWRPLK